MTDGVQTKLPFPANAGTGEPMATVQQFVALLLERQQALPKASAVTRPDAASDRRLTELLLADAALRYARRPGGCQSSRPPQLAVLGPTQTGKSTVVNLILGAPVAAVSPLAGFTTHPHGFQTRGGAEDGGWAAELFPGWQQAAAEELSRDQLERYALTTVAAPEATEIPLPACVVWDTPDFDSLAAHRYRRGVLEVAALADVHVFVLSKEKYFDLSVWQLLRLLGPVGRPLVICLNKLTPDAVESVTASLKQRLVEIGERMAAVPIVMLGYDPDLGASADREPPAAVAELRGHVAAHLQGAPAANHTAGVRAFVRTHWLEWVAPIELEQAARQTWTERVNAALSEALEAYRRDFLEHPQRFDTFRRATAELLNLLELPGFGAALGQVRNVLSWPMRRVLAARQAWLARRRQQRGLPRGQGSEEVVLYQLIEKLLTGLEREVARRADPANPGHAVWRAIARRLEQHEGRLRQTFQLAAEQQREEFLPVIHETANRLYETLQEKPALLNALRAARATTDVAGIALAIKAGGLSINDLLFAPAMFALTSMLAEGALGSYMARIANELKKRQLEHVRSRLTEGVWAGELHLLAADLKDAGLFGVSAEQLRVATRALEAWERSGDE